MLAKDINKNHRMFSNTTQLSRPKWGVNPNFKRVLKRRCISPESTISGLLELRQYKNDGIAERNLFVLKMPRFSLAYTVSHKKVLKNV